MKKNSTILVLDKNENSRNIFKSYIEELKLDFEIRLYENYENGLNDIKNHEGASYVFIDISEEDHNTQETIKNIRLLTSKIIVTSTNYSTDTIVKAMRLGALEFLPKPLLKNDLIRVLSILEQQNLNNEISTSKIITVYSNKGGIGKTTIATNLALELSKTTGDKVALIDLNLQLGDISTFLNLSPTFDVAYFINNLLYKEDDIILKSFEKYENSNMYILSDPNYIEQSSSITPLQIENLFTHLRRIFPYIIIDLSSNIDAVSLKILDKSDYILFTSIVNMPAIRNAQRCLNLFSSRRYPNNKIKIIINRYMENDEIKINDIETALGEKIYWKIPNNYFSIMESINKGIPVSKVNPDSNISHSFRELAEKISDEIIENTIMKHRGY